MIKQQNTLNSFSLSQYLLLKKTSACRPVLLVSKYYIYVFFFLAFRLGVKKIHSFWITRIRHFLPSPHAYALLVLPITKLSNHVKNPFCYCFGRRTETKQLHVWLFDLSVKKKKKSTSEKSRSIMVLRKFLQGISRCEGL